MFASVLPRLAHPHTPTPTHTHTHTHTERERERERAPAARDSVNGGAKRGCCQDLEPTPSTVREHILQLENIFYSKRTYSTVREHILQ